MTSKQRTKRLVTALIFAIALGIGAYASNTPQQNSLPDDSRANLAAPANSSAGEALSKLEIKGRAPKTGYDRDNFGDGWNVSNGCDTRNRILQRDLKDITYAPTTDAVVCKVQSGTLDDPYTGKTMQFQRGADTSDDVQIDHVVALSDAWQKGAQGLDFDTRNQFANDPLNLLAVNGKVNQDKSDSDAATWLPPNKAYRCQYVARQIAVKTRYRLWITRAEYDAMNTILQSCPDITLPTS